MCILSYLPAGVKPDEDGLFNGGLNNPDGHGWAIVAGDRILVGKSMDLAEALDEFCKVREEHLDGPALFHSRYATHGTVNTFNVHPFQVARSPLTVLAHNGVLRQAAHPEKGDPRSDTHKFAEDIIFKQFKKLDKPGVRHSLRQWVKTDKLVILTVDPRHKENSYIINEALGTWDKSTGLWHSNRDYLYYTSKAYRWSSKDYDYWPTKIGKQGGASRLAARAEDTSQWARSTAPKFNDPLAETCLYCSNNSTLAGAPAVDERGYCTYCYSCQDCGENINSCKCYLEDIEEVEVLRKWESTQQPDEAQQMLETCIGLAEQDELDAARAQGLPQSEIIDAQVIQALEDAKTDEEIERLIEGAQARWAARKAAQAAIETRAVIDARKD